MRRGEKRREDFGSRAGAFSSFSNWMSHLCEEGGRRAPSSAHKTCPVCVAARPQLHFIQGPVLCPPPRPCPHPRRSHAGRGAKQISTSHVPPSPLQMSRGRGPGVESDSGGRDCRPDLAVYLQRLSQIFTERLEVKLRSFSSPWPRRRGRAGASARPVPPRRF